jgi:hypothetical protein
MRRIVTLLTAGVMVVAMAVPAFASKPPRDPAGDLVRPVVYVESQGLYYDSVVLTDLPSQGPFQQLFPGAGPEGTLLTEFGPGDQGFVGGRWWVDVNGDGVMDDGDAYFLCPLLGPGRTTPS